MPPQLSCPVCGEPTAELLSGRELQIVSVRWEDGRPHERTREPISEER
jgi:hydrogenase nickel incorporation protein HypA/HybF